MAENAGLVCINNERRAAAMRAHRDFFDSPFFLSLSLVFNFSRQEAVALPACRSRRWSIGAGKIAPVISS